MSWTNEAPDITFIDWFYGHWVPTLEDRFLSGDADKMRQWSIEWAPLFDDAWTDVMLWQSLQDYIILSELSTNYEELQAAFQDSLEAAQKDPTSDEIVIDIEEAIDEGIDVLDVLINTTRDLIIDTIITGTERNKGVVETVIRAVGTEILTGQNVIGDVITGIFGDLQKGVDNSSTILGDILEILQGSVRVYIENKINIPSDVFDVVVGGIGDILDGEHDFIDGVLDRKSVV